jgi:peptide/nickel transport system substrate-binding protein
MIARNLSALAFGICFALPTAAETLRIAIAADPAYVDPAYYGSSSEADLIDNLYPRLAKYVAGDTWKWELDAAKSVDLSDPQHIKFELKPGLMWSGGFGELTAEDVKYSFERHQNPDLASAIASEFALLDSVEVTGTYTGIIHLKAPSASFWTVTMVYTTGAIISKAAAEAGGGYFEATPTATIGPYKVKSFEPGIKLVLDRDAGWIGEPGAFDEIELIPIADDNASVIAFEAGELDYAVVNVLDYDLLSANPPSGGVVRLAQSVDPFWLGITETAEPLKDIRVRKAIQLAVDVPAILTAKSNGRLTQAVGHAAPGTLGARTTPPPARDLEAARALIAEAGAEGTVIRLDFVSTASDGSNTAAQIIQANLAEIGLVVELNGQDEGTFWSIDSIRGTDPQLHLKSWFGNPDVLYFLQYFTREQVGSWNWEAHQNDEYEALIARARTTIDENERAKLYIRMQEILEASGDFLLISHEAYTALSRDTMVPASLPDGRPIFAGFKLK